MAVTLRTLQASELSLAVDWAAAEGWNPGLADAACFATVDAQGFLLAERRGEPVGTISVVNYDERFAFLGFYIVRPDQRGQGTGLQLWQQAIGHAGSRTIGLDGVLAQQHNYRRSGFVLAHRNIRYGGRARPSTPSGDWPRVDLRVDLREVPFAAVEASDRTVFPAARADFLRAWIGAPGHRGRAVLERGRLRGWGVIRPCRLGYKVAPLVADDASTACAIFDDLVSTIPGEQVFIDVPEPNTAAVALARQRGLHPVFETARMYKGAPPDLALDSLYGITSFELG